MPTPLTGTVEILVSGTVPTTGSGAKNIFNVFHYTCGVLPIPDSPLAITVNFLANCFGFVSASLSTSYTGVAVQVRTLDDVFSQYVPTGAPANGAVAGGRLPSDVSVAYLLRSAIRGKNFRGGKRFGPIAEADVVGDELTPAAIAGHWGATTTALTTNLSGVGLVGVYRPVVVSRMLSTLSPPGPAVVMGSFVTAALLNKTTGTMRRRKEKTVR